MRSRFFLARVEFWHSIRGSKCEFCTFLTKKILYYLQMSKKSRIFVVGQTEVACSWSRNANRDLNKCTKYCIMKKILLLLLALPTVLMAQQKVAVYVTAPEGFDPEIKEILGSELVTGVAQNRDFKAVESTANFQQLQNTQDNDQICAIGQQLGVDLVLVANVTTFRDQYYVKGRLLNVRTLAIAASASEASSFASLEDILAVSQKLTGRLFDTVEPVEEEYSKIGYANKNNCDIISIDNTGANTIVTLKLLDPKGTIKWSIYPTTVIRDRATNKEYKLLATNGINTDHSENYGLGIHEFSLTFEKLPYEVTGIDIIEPKGWEWTDIVLKNFGKVGLHQFRDDTQKKFAMQMKEQELMKQQEARLGQIVNIEQSYRSYLITITNENYGSDYLIQLEGKNIGTVRKRSTLTFRIAPENYGQLKAIQVDGYLLKPMVYKWDVPPMRPKDEIRFDIPRP